MTDDQMTNDQMAKEKWRRGAWEIAAWLVRGEIILLSLIYVYFVVSDTVPLAAFAVIALIWIARWWMNSSLAARPTSHVTRNTQHPFGFTQGKVSRFTFHVPRHSPLALPIWIILAWLPLSLWASTNWSLSLPKAYGVILGAACFYAVVNQIVTRRDLTWATFWLALVCIAIALAGLVGTDWAQSKIVSASFIYDHLPRFIQSIPRSIAGGFARNGVGGTLAFTIPLLAVMASQKLKVKSQKSESNPLFTIHCSLFTVDRLLFTVLAWLALTLSLITLTLTQSRGGILGTVVGSLAVAVWRERRCAWLLVVGALGLIVLLALGHGNVLAEFLLRMDARSGTLASRLEVWQRGVAMVQDFPFTGIGIGTYNTIAHSLYPFFIAAPDEVVPHAHNNLLEVAVDLGIPGLIAYVALLTGFVICAVRAYRATVDDGVRALIVGLLCGMLAHQTFGLTDAFILGTKPGVLMWVYFGLMVAVYARQAEWRVTGDG
jgi:putative inorganic carbon (HCO3(-)) transporter